MYIHREIYYARALVRKNCTNIQVTNALRKTAPDPDSGFVSSKWFRGSFA